MERLGAGAGDAKGLAWVARGDDRIAVRPQDLRGQGQHIGLVVHHQNGFHRLRPETVLGYAPLRSSERVRHLVSQWGGPPCVIRHSS